MLSSLVKQQDKMFKMVEDVSKRLVDLENVVSGLAENAAGQSTGPSSSSPEEKRRLPPQLSKLVSKVHEALDDDNQFRPSLGSKDEHNSRVKRRIADEISDGKENVYSTLLVDRAIQRYFESRKRTWRETTDPSQQHRASVQSKKRKLRSRKLRLFECRSKVTHAGKERERFAALTLDYMSEESSSEGGESMFVHQPPW